uniref:Vpu protein n=1 Tax=Simian immunodeficiency virus TaxID=11723 RepID=J7FE38_SIV|nr:vpu protein [Simian immunodeficiency virus]
MQKIDNIELVIIFAIIWSATSVIALLIAWCRQELKRLDKIDTIIDRWQRRLSTDSGIQEDEELNWDAFNPANFDPEEWL